jgi:hypothetical protein
VTLNSLYGCYVRLLVLHMFLRGSCLTTNSAGQRHCLPLHPRAHRRTAPPLSPPREPNLYAVDHPLRRYHRCLRSLDASIALTGGKWSPQSGVGVSGGDSSVAALAAGVLQHTRSGGLHRLGASRMVPRMLPLMPLPRVMTLRSNQGLKARRGPLSGPPVSAVAFVAIPIVVITAAAAAATSAGAADSAPAGIASATPLAAVVGWSPRTTDVAVAAAAVAAVIRELKGGRTTAALTRHVVGKAAATGRWTCLCRQQPSRWGLIERLLVNRRRCRYRCCRGWSGGDDTWPPAIYCRIPVLTVAKLTGARRNQDPMGGRLAAAAA